MKRFLVLPAVLAFTALLWTPGHTMFSEVSAAPEIDQPLDQLTGDAFGSGLSCPDDHAARHSGFERSPRPNRRAAGADEGPRQQEVQ